MSKKSERACHSSSTTDKVISFQMIEHRENLDRKLSCQMVSNTKVNGTKTLICVMERDIKYGVMEVFMRDTGKTIKQTAGED